MRGKFIGISVILFIAISTYAQDALDLEGKVSYLTSQHIYVKFQDTRSINIGDTLQVVKENGSNIPIVVAQKSSTSCVCIKVGEGLIMLEQSVIFAPHKQEKLPDQKDENQVNPMPEPKPEQIVENQEEKQEPEDIKSTHLSRRKGRISLSNYSNFRDNDEAKHRFMGRFSFGAVHINNSKFSFETYLNYRYNLKISTTNPAQKNGYLRIYNLAVNYDINKDFSVLVGRKVNQRLSSLGVVDGIQINKQFGGFYGGLMAGFKPNYTDYGFNRDLFQYGLYGGYGFQQERILSQTTLGLMEQRNGPGIDRRFIHLQHSSTFNRKLNLFTSLELDLYHNLNGITSTDARLSNFYISGRYRFNRKINLTVSYDARKRILLYETFKTEIERLLEDDEARQGVRIRMGLKPLKYINLGLSYGKRFQTNQQNKSDNMNGYITFSKIPIIQGRFTFNVNVNHSNYLQSQIFAIRYSRSFIKNKLKTDMYYRQLNYVYQFSESKLNQNYYGLNIYYRISKNLRINVLTELSSGSNFKNYRFNTKLTQSLGK